MPEASQIIQECDKELTNTVESLFAFLGIQSISTLPEKTNEIEKAANFLNDYFSSKLGFTSRIVRFPDANPIVLAEYKTAKAKSTITFYGHYDVQPVDMSQQWVIKDPFDPQIINDNIIARGASDDKGQLWALIRGVEIAKAIEPNLPYNIRFLIEGEEECAGDGLARFINDNKDELSSDFVFVSDSTFFKQGIPALVTGLRGLLYTEVTVQGAQTDLHSGEFGGVAPNAIHGLVWILAKLKTRTGHITIPRFYDDVVDPTEKEKEDWHKLPFDTESFISEIMKADTDEGDQNFDLLTRKWARPTLDINGIYGGFTDTGVKTVIPAKATAKVSMRLVPNQNPSKIYQAFRHAVHSLCPPGYKVQVKHLSSADPVIIDTSNWLAQKVNNLFLQLWGHPCVHIRMGGTIPVVSSLKQLSQNIVVTGFGLPDDNFHAANEKFSLNQLNQAVKLIALLVSDSG